MLTLSSDKPRSTTNHAILDYAYTLLVITQKSGMVHYARMHHDDYQRLKEFRFNVMRLHNNWYAYTTFKGRNYYLQRLIQGFNIKNMIIHHKLTGDDASIDTLDCRRECLQLLHKHEHDYHHAKLRGLKRRALTQAMKEAA